MIEREELEISNESKSKVFTRQKSKVEVKSKTIIVPVIASLPKVGSRWDYSGKIDYYIIKIILPENYIEQVAIQEVYDLTFKSIQENYYISLGLSKPENKENINVDVSMATHSLLKPLSNSNIEIYFTTTKPTVKWIIEYPMKGIFNEIFKIDT